MSPLPLIALVGPTAVGKSNLAFALAERVGGEIVAADSMQVYRGLDIGTGKPSAEERRRIPHHLLDLVDPDQSFTAADYARLGRNAIADIRGRGSLPIVVGGTGLYVRALLSGLFDGPGEERTLRESLRGEAARVGVSTLHRRLQALDADAASAIHPNDLFRIVRALEVITMSGRPISALRAEARRDRKPIEGRLFMFGLDQGRQELYSRIEARVDQMLARGFLEEVRGLLDRGYSPPLKPLRAIGYRHLVEYVSGHTTLDRAVASLKRDTRRYAKRQLTWFRHEEGVEWHRMDGPAFTERVLCLFVERIQRACASSL